jgi:hypothetical protein
MNTEITGTPDASAPILASNDARGDNSLILVYCSFQGGRKRMRFLVKVSFPVEAGNAAAKKNGFKVIQKILKEQKPEAAYFIADGGQRTGILIIDMKDASDLPRIAEPWFLALNASIEATPAMITEDLQKAAPAIKRAVKTFG